MLKKNMRKRLFAGALAAVMMLTMCPTWALADDEGITTLPAAEGQMPVVDAAPAEDPIQTPDVPSSSDTEAQPAEDQNTAPAPSGGTDIAEAGSNSNSNVNDSQNDNAADNAPVNEIAPMEGDRPAKPVESSVQTIKAEYWITNRQASADGSSSLTIDEEAVGTGKAVAELAPAERRAATTDGTYNTVFWQARVLDQWHRQTTKADDDKTASGTEITSIRYADGQFAYQAKDSSDWTAFADGDQLVFYYLIRTDYSEMVQIDVSDWTVDKEPTFEARRSVTYQVIVRGGEDDGKVLDTKKFWYNKTFTVSSIRVRQTESKNYTIDAVELSPDKLGTVAEVNGEYQFSLDLSKTGRNSRNATVNIYVTPQVKPCNLDYVLNGGSITSAEGTYTAKGKVYPEAPVVTPSVSKENSKFEGWYTDSGFEIKWNGTSMPNADLTLYAKWSDSTTPVEPVDPEPETKTAAKYFVLLPTREAPTSNADQGEANYLPSSKSDGGVKGLSQSTGYAGFLTKTGKEALDAATSGSITDISNGVSSTYLEIPSELGFFNPANWTNGVYDSTKTTTGAADMKKLLGDKFNVNTSDIVWYTIKNQSDGIHVDGYVKNVPIDITYHSNFETDKTYTDTTKTGTNYTALDYAVTKLPTRANYAFGGWYTDQKCTKAYEPTVLMSSLHLYAKWIPNAYNVTYFDYDGTQYEAEETHAVDSIVAVKKNHPEREGYTFEAWKNIANLVTVADDKFTMPAKDVEFKATYTINSYKVKYTVDGVETKSTDYTYGSAVTIDAAPTKEGHDFSGWKIGDKAAEDFTMPAHDVIIEGTFTAKTYKVTYKVDGKETKSTDYTYGSAVTIDAAPTKEGHDFSGWKIGDKAAEDFTMPAHDVIIEGTFSANEYTVTYYVDGEKYAQETYKYGASVTMKPNAVKEGSAFSGWTTKDVTVDGTGFTMPAKNVIIEGFFTQNKHQYTIKKHFYDGEGKEIAAMAAAETKTGNENALITELYKDCAVNQTVDSKTYVYVPGLTTVDPTGLEKLTRDVTIDLHYYLDVKGSTTDPDNKGNDTPDAWEYRLTFKVVNGEWNDGGNADIVVYVPFKDKKDGKELRSVQVPATSIPAVGDKPYSGYRAGSWDKTPVGGDKVTADTVFTYTYARRSSSGGGGGSRKPTVEIPDEVPTGLNGDDHYAYIVGYPDSTVRPQNGITRAEVATIFFRLLTDETRDANSTKSNSYSDVASGAWYNHAVSTLSAMGIIKGSNGKFNPNAPITRAEFAAIAARFDDKANTTAVDFSDIASHWAKDEISAAANNGWINGYTDGTFRPNNKITRAEAMTLVNRVLKRLPETAEDLHNDMIKWSDNADTSKWFYLAVQEATNSHYYDTKENQYEKWNKLRDTRDWTELEK